MNTRINAIPTIEQALKTLEAFGYDASSVWSQHNAWLVQLDERAPTDHDARWAKRNKEPSALADHFDKNGVPEVLSAANAFKDRHYSLSPGQRDVLRNRYGLTPAKTIILTDVALFPGTNIIWSVNIRSAEHIDITRRRHVLAAAVIAPVAKFFDDAQARDKEREHDQLAADEARIANGQKAISVKGRALQYFE
jgi:hypothetical protein